MIDSSPVTFEMTDCGGVRWVERSTGHTGICAPYTTKFEGEGFSVVSEFHTGERTKCDRAALERAGVDTATVEYLDMHHTPHEDVLAWFWRPLFPSTAAECQPVLREEPATTIPSAITHLSSNPEMPPRADEGIIAAMVDACAVHIPDPAPVMQNIYNAIRRHLRDSKFKPQPTFEESRERITEWNRAHGASLVDEPSSIMPGEIRYIDADRMTIAEAKVILVALEATPEVHRRLEAVVKLAEDLLEKARMR